MQSRESIACELLGVAALEAGGYAPCPGRMHHSKGNGRRDFRVSLEGAPTGFCFHSSCSGEVESFNVELRRRIWRAEHGNDHRKVNPWGGNVAREPNAKPLPKRPPFDETKLRKMAMNVRDEIDGEWLRARSPSRLAAGMRNIAADFLDALYADGERVLIFTEFKSQGQFLYWCGRGGYRLASQREVKAVKSELPAGGKDGVWFLSNPVTGEWRINNGAVNNDGSARWGRRHGDCVTAWRYLVLESDEASPDLWLKMLVQLPLRIAAIYTSGGRSIHALVRVDADSKPQWDRMRDAIASLVVPLGADPAAMTAVRLTRLPGCMRGDRLQELWYLDPRPRAVPLWRARAAMAVAA